MRYLEFSLCMRELIESIVFLLFRRSLRYEIQVRVHCRFSSKLIQSSVERDLDIKKTAYNLLRLSFVLSFLRIRETDI
jgi:hypothetical protein